MPAKQAFDLNLIRVFDAVMRRRSVSAASRELEVTASAVSHALSRLRRALNDELFIPGDSGMEPTQRALDVYPGLRDGLAQIEAALISRNFDAPGAARTFNVAASDYAATLVIPPLMTRVAALAPDINLRVFPESRIDVVRHLDDGRIGFALGSFGDVPDRLMRATIFVEQEAVVARSGHPLTRGPVTREALLSATHVAVQHAGGDEPVKRLMPAQAESRVPPKTRVAVTVPHYGAVEPLLEASDMVATMPRRLALKAAERGGIVILDLPFTPQEMPIEAIWHRKSGQDPGLRWLLNEVTEAFRPPSSQITTAA